MLEFNKPFGKIAIGIIFILIGIVAKQSFNLGALTMIFHLAGGVFLVWGVVQLVAKKR